MRTPRLIPLLLTIGMLVAACGTGAETAQPDNSTTTTASRGTETPATTATSEPAASTTTATSGGWIKGEPDWHGEDATAYRSAAARDESATDFPTADTAAESDAGGPVPPPGGERVGPLRAGSVDDNVDFAGFLSYLDRIADLGVALRPFDPAGRIVVSVAGADGRPIAGAAVRITDTEGDIATVSTTADGTARFLPALYDEPVDGTFTFTIGDVSVDASAGTPANLVLDRPGGADEVALDVLFLLDATGSMGDEIERLKVSIDSIAARVDELEGSADTRFAMTLYRDEGDSFVTSTFDFTSDVADFRAALAGVVANGGGDYPEALDEGLAEALNAPSWRDPAEVVQLVVLVADAPPQIGRQVETPYTASIRTAVSRGIKIFPVASSESDDQAEAVFRQLAQASGARFVFLTYGAGGAATGGSTDIERTDYEELALDDLVVRLIAEEVAALIGDADVVPPTTPTTTTQPDGQ